MKKLLLSVIAVIVTVAALGTSTFAWFTLSNKASVGDFNAQVTSGEGIEIRIDGQNNWYTDIPASVMQDHIEAQKVKFKDLTSANGVDLKNFKGGAASVGSYYEVTLQFRAAQATNIYWVGTTLSGEGTLPTWQPDAKFSYRGVELTSESEEIYIDVSDAARISVANGTNTYVYEKPGVTNGNTNMSGIVFSSATKLPTSGSVAYYNAKNVDDQIILETYKAVKLVDTFSSFDTSELTNNKKVVTLTGSGTTFTGKITVRVYLEGWDDDTFNSILGEKLFASLRFEGVPVDQD